MCILNCADDNPSSISIALIPALSENTESKSLAIRDKFWVKFQNNCKLIGDSFIKSWFKVDLHFNFLITGTFEVFICLLNDKRIETYFLMTNHFRFQKLVFYWLKPVPRPAVCFVEFFCAAKRPRIEALKLQMCVMVIRPLFAPILMTDLIPVFKRPTESRRYYMETDILDNICVDYFYTFFLNYYNCRFLSRTATLMKWDLKKFWGANFAKVAFHPTLELSTFKYWEIKSGTEVQKPFHKIKNMKYIIDLSECLGAGIYWKWCMHG